MPDKIEGRSVTGSADAEGDCSGWNAFHDHQPIGPPRLRVTGECVFPTPGYTVELRPAVPQGVNPKIYIFDRIVKPPEGIVPQVITKVPVRYEEKTTEEYSHVQIRPDSTLIEVNDVH